MESSCIIIITTTIINAICGAYTLSVCVKTILRIVIARDQLDCVTYLLLQISQPAKRITKQEPV